MSAAEIKVGDAVLLKGEALSLSSIGPEGLTSALSNVAFMTVTKLGQNGFIDVAWRDVNGHVFTASFGAGVLRIVANR